MASPDQPGFFSFATLPMPSRPQGAYQTAGLLMKIEGWLSVAAVAMLALVGIIVMGMLVVVGVVGGVLWSLLPGPWGALGGLGIGLVVAILAAGLLVVAAVYLAFLYWISWIYAKWTGGDPRALQHLKVYAIVAIVLGGLGAVGSLGTANPSVLLDLAGLVIGIMMLVQANDPTVRQHFQPGFRPVAGP